MRMFRRLAVFAATAALLLGPAAGVAGAAARPATHAPATAWITGGTTTVTTGAGIAAVLVKNGIVPLATDPGSSALTTRPGYLAERFAFPVTGGKITLSPLAGQVRHRGGILFLSPRNGKQVQVSNFIINLARGTLTGIVNGNPRARVALFRLDLSHAHLSGAPHVLRAVGIGLVLTATAARALNAALGTSLFSAGLRLGSAATVLRI
jgi:hypothetical protein